MKKKAIFFSSLALSGALALGLIAVMSSKAGVPAHSEVSAYTLTLSSYSSLQNGAYTTLGNRIDFSFDNASSSGGKIALESGGNLYNETAISGISAVRVRLSSGSVSLYYGTTSNASFTYAATADSYDFSSIRPNYVKIVAESAALIDAIEIDYACYDYQAAAAEEGYALYLNDRQVDAVAIDATKEGEGYDQQVKWTLDLLPGDVLSFTKDSSGIYPTASGDGNNAEKTDGRGYLLVKDEKKGADVYLKRTGNNYDVWLTGKGGAKRKSSIPDGTILHAWNWSVSSLLGSGVLQGIADAGYRAIQLSPMQIKPYVTTSDTWAKWWELYQPFGFDLAVNSNQSVIGTKDQLRTLCANAKALGISIIMDVVVNHLCGENVYTLNGGVNTYESEIYNHKADYVHNLRTISNYNDDEEIIHGALGGLPDLKTENFYIQERALSLFKQCLDCGVEGFRIDAAKHIESPKDEYPLSSSFYPYLINGAKRYAESKGYEIPYFYGEIIGATDGGRNASYFTPYMSITEGINDTDLRDGLSGPNVSKISGNYFAGTEASNLVLWVESHDDYQADTKNWLSEEIANKGYAIQASRSEATALYLARPSDGNTKMGAIGSTAYKSKVVAAANELHSRYAGQGEYIDVNSTTQTFVNVRGSGEEAGAMIVNIAHTDSSKNVYLPNMANGTYRDLISDREFTVSSNRATVSFTNGVCVLVPSSPASYYIVGNTTFTGTSASWTAESGLLMNKTLENLAELEDVEITTGAEVKIIKQRGGDTTWYGNLGTTYNFASVNGGGNIEFSQSGTYNFFLNTEGNIYLVKQGGAEPEPELTGDVTVNFTANISADTAYGQAVYIIGDFCGWNIGSGVRLNYASAKKWTGTMTKASGTSISYKFVIGTYDSPSGVIKWESGGNRSLTFDGNTTQVTATVTWQ